MAGFEKDGDRVSSVTADRWLAPFRALQTVRLRSCKKQCHGSRTAKAIKLQLHAPLQTCDWQSLFSCFPGERLFVPEVLLGDGSKLGVGAVVNAGGPWGAQLADWVRDAPLAEGREDLAGFPSSQSFVKSVPFRPDFPLRRLRSH